METNQAHSLVDHQFILWGYLDCAQPCAWMCITMEAAAAVQPQPQPQPPPLPHNPNLSPSPKTACWKRLEDKVITGCRKITGEQEGVGVAEVRQRERDTQKVMKWKTDAASRRSNTGATLDLSSPLQRSRARLPTLVPLVHRLFGGHRRTRLLLLPSACCLPA